MKEVGRPNIGGYGSMSSSDLTGILYESIQKIKSLDKSLRIYPRYDSSSVKSKSNGIGHFSTLAVQHEENPGFLINNKD